MLNLSLSVNDSCCVLESASVNCLGSAAVIYQHDLQAVAAAHFAIAKRYTVRVYHPWKFLIVPRGVAGTVFYSGSPSHNPVLCGAQIGHDGDFEAKVRAALYT